MKRYDIDVNIASPNDMTVLRESESGRWVKYSDVMRDKFGGYRAKDDPILVIIVEHDVNDPFRSNGAIIMEQYTRNCPDTVMERAKMFAKGGTYGRVWVGRVADIAEVQSDD